MRIVVTGGAGYVGSVIVEQLVADGHSVTVLDNLSKGRPEALVAGAELVNLDLIDQSAVQRILARHKTETVIHMAAASLVGESVINPRIYYRNNVEAGLSLLNAMVDAGVRNLVFSSTAAVYGEPVKHPIEESDPTIPTNTYGETKLVFEKALHWYSSAYGMQYTSLRYFNAAGATKNCGELHDPETHLIPIVLQTAAGKREQVEVFGNDYDTRDGTCVRDYIHVIDLAQAHVLAMQKTDQNRILNLGCGGTGYTVLEVLKAAEQVTGRKVPYRVVPRRPGDPATLIASSEKIRQELDWTPQHQDLTRIIESAWSWMQQHTSSSS